MAKKSTSKSIKNGKVIGKRADQYDDGDYNYLHYWRERDYEHAAEEHAIKRLLKGHQFKKAVDIGGGYGRLCLLLKHYADDVTLAEPSKKQLEIAEEFLKNNKDIHKVRTQADKLSFKDKTFDLITMIRVMHHLPDPSIEFKELQRVMSDDGWLILEVANYAHARNRIRHAIKGKRLPEHPIDIRSEENKNDAEIAFVNHNPKTVIKQLAHAGLKVEKTLSVSNLRSPGLKKIMPHSVMLSVEKLLQKPLSRAYFGPSVFFLVKKASK